jgi:Bax protein
MIKYFLILISVTIASFSSEHDYFLLNSYYSNSDFDENSSLVSSELNGVNIHSTYTKKKKSSISNERFARPIYKRIHSPADITIFKHKRVKPINYVNTVSLNKLEVSEKKKKFFHMILPAILISKHKFKVLRNRVKRIINDPNPSSKDLAFLKKMYKKFKTEDNKELLIRMKTHPVSIVLAQAAIESAWGESRFFKEGNNIFGMWSFNKNEPRMRARETRNGKAIYLKKYKSLSDAIDDYFVTIGRGAYDSFRKHRNITDDPLQLVQYLVNYCELKEKYTRRLRRFIIKNRLTQFDDFKLDSNYL